MNDSGSSVVENIDFIPSKFPTSAKSKIFGGLLAGAAAEAGAVAKGITAGEEARLLADTGAGAAAYAEAAEDPLSSAMLLLCV